MLLDWRWRLMICMRILLVVPPIVLQLGWCAGTRSGVDVGRAHVRAWNAVTSEIVHIIRSGWGGSATIVTVLVLILRLLVRRGLEEDTSVWVVGIAVDVVNHIGWQRAS